MSRMDGKKTHTHTFIRARFTFCCCIICTCRTNSGMFTECRTTMFVCMALTTGQGCQSCSWSAAEQGKLTICCPRSRLRVWSRESGSAVPSRVTLLISILNLVLAYGIPPEFRGGVHSSSVHIICTMNATVHIRIALDTMYRPLLLGRPPKKLIFGFGRRKTAAFRSAEEKKSRRLVTRPSRFFFWGRFSLGGGDFYFFRVPPPPPPINI